MSVINIREAKRTGAKLLIGLSGVSGGGKTYTALQLAYGLANKQSNKIGLLDTENRRGSLYADKLPNKEKFLIGDLLPPFSPQRYIEAIKEFQSTGIEVLIIDSVTHEYEGEGGCVDIAENNKLGGLPNWARAKMEHKRFLNTLLLSDMHVICCVRAREKTRPDKQKDEITGKDKTVFINDGLMPITEKNFMFEMTASLMIKEQGKLQDILKVPQDLLPMLGRCNGYIGIDDGLAIRAWVDGVEIIDKELENAKSLLEVTCIDGYKAVENIYKEFSTDIKQKLQKDVKFMEIIKNSAKSYDEINETNKSTN